MAHGGAVRPDRDVAVEDAAVLADLDDEASLRAHGVAVRFIR